MRLLLDTHILIWWRLDFSDLRAEHRSAIADPNIEIFVSAASIWELAIKIGKKKIEFPSDFIETYEEAGFKFLSITPEHTWATRNLPPHHSDPFDRIIIAQALVENLVLVTSDKAIFEYDVAILGR